MRENDEQLIIKSRQADSHTVAADPQLRSDRSLRESGPVHCAHLKRLPSVGSHGGHVDYGDSQHKGQQKKEKKRGHDEKSERTQGIAPMPPNGKRQAPSGQDRHRYCYNCSQSARLSLLRPTLSNSKNDSHCYCE